MGCVFYRTASGQEPVRSWLREQDSEVRLQVGSDIQKVQWRWPISRPLVGAIGDGLYEVRTSHDKNIYRVFFCIHENNMVLLHAFQKKTQQLPDKELKLARKRQKEVMSQ